MADARICRLIGSGTTLITLLALTAVAACTKTKPPAPSEPQSGTVASAAATKDAVASAAATKDAVASAAATKDAVASAAATKDAVASAAATKDAVASAAATKDELGKTPEPAADQVVNLFIWPNYTSPELLKQFTEQTGIKVIESNYASNEELLAKLQAGATGYDLAVPSDYMVAAMKQLGLLESLDKSQVPNLANLDPQFTGKPYDPQNTVSLPYAWSITGIAVNTSAYAEPVTGWADLLNNPKAAGRVSLLDDAREVIGAALKMNGASLNTVKPEELQQAKATVVAAKKHVKTFNSSPLDAIVTGDVWISHMYGQEAVLAARQTGGKVAFVIPKEGGTMAIDNLVVLKSAPHKAAAYKLMNFLLEVKSNVDFVARVGGGPVLTATKALLPPQMQSDPTLFPPAEALAKCEMMQDLGDGTALYDRIWSEIKVASH